MDLHKAIRDRLAELRAFEAGRGYTFDDGIEMVCSAIEAALDAAGEPDEAAQQLADAIRERDDAIALREAGDKRVRELDAELRQEEKLLLLQAEEIRIAYQDVNEAREAARWLFRELDGYGWGSAVPLQQSLARYPWLLEKGATP